VTGGRALRWDTAGVLSILPLREGDEAAQAFAINNAGIVAGGAGPVSEFIFDPKFPPALAYLPQAVVWEGANVLALGGIGEDPVSYIRDMNDDGVAIGESGTFDSKSFVYNYRPALWSNGIARDFGSLVDPFTPGWQVIQLHAINNAGVVAGIGSLSGALA